jgi:hypothetical protein
MATSGTSRPISSDCDNWDVTAYLSDYDEVYDRDCEFDSSSFKVIGYVAETRNKGNQQK